MSANVLTFPTCVLHPGCKMVVETLDPTAVSKSRSMGSSRQVTTFSFQQERELKLSQIIFPLHLIDKTPHITIFLHKILEKQIFSFLSLYEDGKQEVQRWALNGPTSHMGHNHLTYQSAFLSLFVSVSLPSKKKVKTLSRSVCVFKVPGTTQEFHKYMSCRMKGPIPQLLSQADSQRRDHSTFQMAPSPAHNRTGNRKNAEGQMCVGLDLESSSSTKKRKMIIEFTS